MFVYIFLMIHYSLLGADFTVLTCRHISNEWHVSLIVFKFFSVIDFFAYLCNHRFQPLFNFFMNFTSNQFNLRYVSCSVCQRFLINLIPSQLVIFVENLEQGFLKLSSWRFEGLENQRQPIYEIFCRSLFQWRNVGGLAKMAPLGGKKAPPVAPLGYKLTRSNF